MKKLILSLLCCLCTMGAWAEEYTDANGVTWTYSYSSSSQSITLTAATGLGENVVCPDVITHDGVEYPVTSIGSGVFSSNKTIKTVELPEGLTSIGWHIFYECTGLVSISIPKGVTFVASDAFYNCPNLEEVHISDIAAWCNINSMYSNPLDYASKLFVNDELVTDLVIPEGVTTIRSEAFRNCKYITSITIPESVTSIGSSAFSGCSSLASITIPESVTSIGSSAFSGCSSLTSITIPEGVTSIGSTAFSGCSSLTSITIPEGVTSIGSSAFNGCSNLEEVHISDIAAWCNMSLSVSNSYYGGTNPLEYAEKLVVNGDFVTDVVIPEGVTSIGNYAFYGYEALTSITIPKSVTSIGSGAFSGCDNLHLIYIAATTPPALSATFNEEKIIVVPNKEAYEAYCADATWGKYLLQLTYEEAATKSVTLTANEEVSALYTAIGEDNLKYVYDLTIEGTINGKDIYIMRNKMTALRKLDLSKARIVSGGGEYYQSYTTENDVVGAYAFYELDLWEVKLPETLTRIKNDAFRYCSYLQRIEIPEGVTSIGYNAFQNCNRLEDVKFPTTLKYIGTYAFGGCSRLTKIVLPIGLETIASYAFQSCSSLKEVRFPSGLKSLGSSAFSYCNAITDVYSYTIEPIEMAEETFSEKTIETATLHYPLTSKYNYYTNGGWGQFLNMEEFDETYEYFYLNNDYTLNEENGGTIDGTPDADLNEGSGLIVEGDLDQKTDDMHIHHNGGHGCDGVGGSIIADDNLHANKVHFRIDVKGGKWHFFSFPFHVKKENIKCEGGADWIFHYYDGKERAANGKGGWKKVTSEEGQGNFLKAGVGYIFQSSKDDVLVITVDEDDDESEEGIRFNKKDKHNGLETHECDNEQDASWNFTGNPNLSYYDLDTDTYDAPITVWDGSKYVAVRPGDDDYQLAPFQAFFVQKPEGVDEIEFKGDKQMTYQQKEHKAEANAVLAYSRTRVNPNRLIVNITLAGDTDSDKTRVVFNNARAMSYEMACDAAKFATADVPQLYTMDNRKVRYAINERPQEEGTVPVGYSVPAAGTYTLGAPRMDTPMVLKDLLTGIIHDFSEGDYEFASEAGTFENRFVLMTRAAVTDIDAVTLGHIKVTATEGAIEVSGLGGATLNVFTTGGEKVATCQADGQIAVSAGIYVVEANGKSVKVVVK